MSLPSKTRHCCSAMQRPIVWHLLGQYLLPTETFIYSTLTKLKRCQPVVISFDPVVNLDAFPIGRRPLYCLHERLRSPRYFLPKAQSSLTGRDWVEKAEKRELEIIAKDFKPDIIHAHFGPTGYNGLKLKRALGAPLFTTFYGFDTNVSPPDRQWQTRREELFASGDLFLVEGPFMRSRLVSLGCPVTRLRIQRIGVDLTNIPRIRRTSRGARPVVLFAARFVEKKGLEYGLLAIERLCRTGYRLECRIIGSGPLEGRLRAFVERNRLETVVQFLGNLKYSEYLKELASADIFVQPSVTAEDGDCEGGAPTSILEAQACGVPVVSTLHADIPNVVVPGRSAFLVPERDSGALANAIAELLERPEDWLTTMGREGRRFIEEHHSSDQTSNCLDELYSSYPSEPSGAPGLNFVLTASGKRMIDDSKDNTHLATHIASSCQRPKAQGVSRSPVVSVVMTVRNGERFVERSIRSIFAQTCSDWEFIIVNDGSTDATAEIVDTFQSNDERITVLHRPARGIPISAHEGCSVARGTYIARLDADDESKPDRLATQVAFLNAHPRVALVGSAYAIVDENEAILRFGHPPCENEAIQNLLPLTNCFLQSTVMMRKTAYEAVGGYRLPFRVTSDYDLWLRLAERYEVAHVPQVLSIYRIHGTQISVGKLEEQALAHVAASVAAKWRRQKGTDPLDGVAGLTKNYVMSIGATEKDLYVQTLASYMLWRQHVKYAGSLQRQSFVALIDSALAFADKRRGNWCGRELRTLRQERAAIAFDDGEYIKALALLLKARGAHPRRLMRALIRRFENRRCRGLDTCASQDC